MWILRNSCKKCNFVIEWLFRGFPEPFHIKLAEINSLIYNHWEREHKEVIQSWKCFIECKIGLIWDWRKQTYAANEIESNYGICDIKQIRSFDYGKIDRKNIKGLSI